MKAKPLHQARWCHINCGKKEIDLEISGVGKRF
jgi:hypothetical protein